MKGQRDCTHKNGRTFYCGGGGGRRNYHIVSNFIYATFKSLRQCFLISVTTQNVACQAMETSHLRLGIFGWDREWNCGIVCFFMFVVEVWSRTSHLSEQKMHTYVLKCMSGEEDSIII